MINALVNKKSLARISNTPGRTREINFFNLGQRLILVDLPGYGYARASKKRIKKWTLLVNSYLQSRSHLLRTFILIDARHGLKDLDLEFLSMLDNAAQSYQLILTKCDKLKKNSDNPQIASLCKVLKAHAAAVPEICSTSSKTGEGIPYLRSTVAKLVPTVKLS